MRKVALTSAAAALVLGWLAWWEPSTSDKCGRRGRRRPYVVGCGVVAGGVAGGLSAQGSGGRGRHRRRR